MSTRGNVNRKWIPQGEEVLKREHGKTYSLLRVILLVICLGLALFLALTPLGHRVSGVVFAPFVSIANGAAELCTSGVRFLMPGVRKNSERLLEAERRISELEALLAAQADLRRENEELRRLVSLPPPQGWRAILAEVISRDPQRWNDRLLVNRGSEDGLTTGVVVLVDGKVFGRVLKCYRHSAEIVTILSSECRFGVAISRSDAVGVLQGGGEERFLGGTAGFVVDYLPKDLRISPEQMVVTSGLGGWMPAGIPVGDILADAPNGRKVHSPDGARSMIHGVPVAPFGAFHFVSVLVPKN